MPSSKGSSRPRDQTSISYLHWQVGSLLLAPSGKPSKERTVGKLTHESQCLHLSNKRTKQFQQQNCLIELLKIKLGNR